MDIFNYIIANSDLHDDNYGLLYDSEKFEFKSVSPCYDHNVASILQVLCKYKIVQKNLFKWTELNSVHFYVIRKISTCQ